MVGKFPRNIWFLAVLIACSIGSVATPVRADGLDLQGQIDALWTTISSQQQQSLRDRILGPRTQYREVAVVRFSSQGGPAFVLDQTSNRPLLRFDGSNEIWVLRPSAGLRGDIYYRNDVGEVMLRTNRLGGVTLYTGAAPNGLPCAVVGEARRLNLPEHDIRFLLRHFMRESVRAGQAIGQDFEITARAVDPAASDVYGDAATVAVDGIAGLAGTRGGRERMSGLRSILISSGPGPDVRRDGETLLLTVSPRLGAAGRPSSARVARALS